MVPRAATHRGESSVLRLCCQVETGAADGNPGVTVPGKLAEFWRHASGARLFEDTEYGQWGLVLLSPDEAVRETEEFRKDRARDYVDGDLIVGLFLGDQDLLLVRCDPEVEDFERVLVALPLDTRIDWYEAAPNLSVFLEKYERAEGAKYWEEE